jgi:acyl-CoA synthetase (AMP-forming)/AMP-acid ligase II
MIPSAAPVPEASVTQVLFGERRRVGPALVDATSGRTLSYADLTSAVWSVAAGLIREGLGPGTVVALHLPDTPEFAVAAHGVMASGAVLTPARPTITAETMARQLTETGARAVITWPVLLDIALEAVKSARVERVFCFGAEPDVEPFSRLWSASPPEHPWHTPATSPALISYTRGTTGPPKGVRLTHRNLVAGFLQFASACVLSDTDTVLSAIPFADVIGLAGVLNPALQAGAIVVTRSGTGRHDLLRTLQDHRVTVALLTPELVEILAYEQMVSRYNLGLLRSIISTGGPLRPEIARACSIRLRCPVRQAYGLAETAGLTHLNLRAIEEGTLDSVGPGLFWTGWRIVDPAGTDLPSYQPGELRIRGPMVTSGYVPDRPLPEWLPTGDTAFADDHGRVYIMGRISEAESAPPTAPDGVLAAHPAVTEAVVVAVPDPGLGLVPHAFVVLREEVSAADLLTYVNSHVQSYDQIHAVHVTEVIPRSSSGRILRRALIERARLSPDEGR